MVLMLQWEKASKPLEFWPIPMFFFVFWLKSWPMTQRAKVIVSAGPMTISCLALGWDGHQVAMAGWHRESLYLCKKHTIELKHLCLVSEMLWFKTYATRTTWKWTNTLWFPVSLATVVEDSNKKIRKQSENLWLQSLGWCVKMHFKGPCSW